MIIFISPLYIFPTSQLVSISYDLFKPCPRLNYMLLQTNNYPKLNSKLEGSQLKSNSFNRTGLRGK